MNAKFKVVQAGPSVSVQDAGRRGFMRFGVPHSGPMDRVAYKVLTTAIDSPVSVPVIEVSLGGLALKCIEGAVTVGFVGGEFDLDVDGRKLGPWSVFTIEAGMTLTIRPGAKGSWGYLGFVGVMQAREWLGSRSNHLNSGLCGRPIVMDDMIIVENAKVKPEFQATLPIPNFANFNGKVRAVLGPQDRFFSAKTIAELEAKPFTITPNYDRMGMRLSGEKLAVEGELTMLSEALLRGTVQVAGHGDPVILLADHQTTGGYPKIATVLTADISRLTQARAGDEVRFTLVTPAKGIDITRSQQAELNSYLEKIPGLRGTFEEKLFRSNLISGVYDESAM